MIHIIMSTYFKWPVYYSDNYELCQKVLSDVAFKIDPNAEDRVGDNRCFWHVDSGISGFIWIYTAENKQFLLQTIASIEASNEIGKPIYKGKD